MKNILEFTSTVIKPGKYRASGVIPVSIQPVRGDTFAVVAVVYTDYTAKHCGFIVTSNPDLMLLPIQSGDGMCDYDVCFADNRVFGLRPVKQSTAGAVAVDLHYFLQDLMELVA